MFTFFSCRQKGFQLRSLDSAVKRLECVSPFVTLLECVSPFVTLLWSIFLFEKAPQLLGMSMRKQRAVAGPDCYFPISAAAVQWGGNRSDAITSHAKALDLFSQENKYFSLSGKTFGAR